MNTYRNHSFSEKKRIALVAHDNMKPVLIRWCRDNCDILKKHELCGTGTTARLISDYTGLEVKGYKSGPLGGDQKIGTLVADGELDMVIFFSDPLTAQPHDPDVKALIRIAQVYDIPIAHNKATADYMITSPLFNSAYTTESLTFSAPSTGSIDVGR